MNKELLVKAKKAKTPEELLCLAKENGEEITEESAKAYFELLHPQTGEIADEELDNVSGGGCYKGDKLVVSAMHFCDEWCCKNDGSKGNDFLYCRKCGVAAFCHSCRYCTYEKGLWLCSNPANMKK